MMQRILKADFFDRDAQEVARDLLGKVLAHRPGALWLAAAVVEAEAYYIHERGSHASLGYTEKRKALFMPPGTIYMYYARGGDSLNVSCRGEGNAVLLKAGCPRAWGHDAEAALAEMRRRNPLPTGQERPAERLCAGQTLLCKALGLRVPDWDQLPLPQARLRFLDVGYRPARIVRTTRLGIPAGRDPHLPYRFVDAAHVGSATQNPLRRGSRAGRDYELLLMGPE
jgi:DNA-3-methyladenine glycosylase